MKGFGLVLAAVCTGAAAARADVIVVDAAGKGNSTTISGAVIGAHDGDVILVRPGTYGAFFVKDLSLTVVADPPGSVKVTGTVGVRQVAAGSTVVVRGFEVKPSGGFFGQALPMDIQLCDGAVRIEDCALQGAGGWNGAFGDCGQPSGTEALHVSDSSDVAFVRCTLTGGKGHDADDFMACSGDSGEGAVVQHAHVAFHDCTVTGGKGASAFAGSVDPPWQGATGAQLTDSGAWISGGSISGGQGGAESGNGQSGGAGLAVLGAGAPVQVLGAVLVGGQPGSPPGSVGPPLVGPAQLLAGTPRHFSAPAAVREGEDAALVAQGLAGEAVLLLGGVQGGLFTLPGQLGPIQLQLPFTFIQPLGGVPAGGELSLPFTAPHMPAGFDAVVVHLQVWFGGGVLGPPSTLVLLDDRF